MWHHLWGVFIAFWWWEACHKKDVFLNQCILFYCHTAPSAVKYLNYSRDTESITLTWPPAQSMLDGYALSINSKVFNEKKMFPSGVRYDDYIVKITEINSKHLFPWIFKITMLCYYLYVFDGLVNKHYSCNKLCRPDS